jgi:hypothetical protein
MERLLENQIAKLIFQYKPKDSIRQEWLRERWNSFNPCNQNRIADESEEKKRFDVSFTVMNLSQEIYLIHT